jgi:hypothetical protein
LSFAAISVSVFYLASNLVKKSEKVIQSVIFTSVSTIFYGRGGHESAFFRTFATVERNKESIPYEKSIHTMFIYPFILSARLSASRDVCHPWKSD